MSTRATYSFEHQYFNKMIISYYIHHDNYPKGAAIYFWNMHNKRCDAKGSFAEVFIKANIGTVEFSEGHDSHCDTEYQYHVNQEGILTAKELTDFATRTFDVFYEGHYAEFINLHQDYIKEYCPEVEKIYKLSQGIYPSSKKRDTYMTVSEVKSEVIELYTYLLKGYSQYRDQHARWEEEYKILCSLDK